MDRAAYSMLEMVLEEDRKMAFLSGPRQVGKTTLAESYRKNSPQGLYFNWDSVADQKRLAKDPYFFEKADRDPNLPYLIVLDEIHKYARWKNYLKGAFDKFKSEFRFLVTGSGRLDLFKKGGDSLMGRYERVPLFPLTVAEVSGRPATLSEFKAGLPDMPGADTAAREAFGQLLAFSGFPEPFLRADDKFYLRWFQERKANLIREDIRDASRIREISLLEMLSHLIPDRIGGLLSLNALREDVGVAFDTVRDWIGLLEQFYYLFRIYPFTGNMARTLKKEAKAYLFDWVEAPSEASRFENLVALHLFKAVQTWKAAGEGVLTLNFLRDKEKREVDFVLAEKGKPLCLVECKSGDSQISPALLHFQERLGVPAAIQLVRERGVSRKTGLGGRTQWVVSAERWLAKLV